ncbi:tyrosine-type recombinase/integrase [Streptomyces violascens]|uniref:tyrosine-type recombinase/integrase n=1 Tax=Streptomyces violascens TaxID=67381 RepID=UPI0037B9CE0D
MAGYIEDRWIKKKKDSATGKRERTTRYGKGKRYRVGGIPGVRDMSFAALEDAKKWLSTASTDKGRGEFVDPRDGSIELADYVERFWWPGVRGGPGTMKRMDERVRLHILPHLGNVALHDVTATVLRSYIKKLEDECAARYARQILAVLSNIFETAIDDKRVIRNPLRAKSVSWPKPPDDRREAWPLATALKVRDAITARYRIAVVVGLGCGLRQGEVFGLSPEDVDFTRGLIRVRRQVQLLSGRLYFALPKGGKTRTVDMPESVAQELAAYFADYPAVEVELPWGGPGEEETKKFPLMLTTTYGNALRANIFNVEVWKPALAAAGVIPAKDQDGRWQASRKDGFHVLRHTYASILLEAGESVVTLARWLGHSSPTVTLDFYAHFMPEAGAKGRTAINALLGAAGEGDDVWKEEDAKPGDVSAPSSAEPTVYVTDLVSSLLAFQHREHAETVVEQWQKDRPGRSAVVEEWSVQRWEKLGPGGMRAVRDHIPDRRLVYQAHAAFMPDGGKLRTAVPERWVVPAWEFMVDEYSTSPAQWRTERRPGPGWTVEAQVRGTDEAAVAAAFDRACREAVDRAIHPEKYGDPKGW